MDTFIKINLAFLGFACAVGFSALLIMAMGAVERFLQKYMVIKNESDYRYRRLFR